MKRKTRFDIEAVLVKKSAMHKLGTDDIDPDMDATYICDHRDTEAEAKRRAEELYREYESRLMWNCVTIQQEVFGDDDGNPVWEAVGEMRGFYGDEWR